MGCFGWCNYKMGLLTCSSLIILSFSLGLGYLIFILGLVPEVPDVKVTYWGPGAERADNVDIRPFKINVSESVLSELNSKLKSTRKLVPPLEGVGFSYGMNSEYFQTILEFWKTKYNWRQREVYLNSFPQFVTQIGGLDIHFIHAKPDTAKAKGKQVLPLLMIHGWPGSVREFYEIIPLLTTPKKDQDFVFEVIAPSLPGYGFSQGASKPGLGPAQMGALFNELMTRLGFNTYYIQGGDWGSVIGKSMSIIFPKRVIGYHSNLCFPQTFTARYRTLLAFLFPSWFIKEEMQASFASQFVDFFAQESGYLHLQATKPDTVGVALSDSPAGLAAYIVEKFSTWTNKANRQENNGGLDVYNKADLLDNVMIYWVTNSITTSMRLYSEAMSINYRSMDLDKIPVTVPTACAIFPNEILYYPAIILEGAYTNLISANEMKAGGHFAAFEQPKLLAEDVWAFVKALRAQKKKKA